MRSGSAVVVLSVLYFFFLTDAGAGLSFLSKCVAALILIVASLIALGAYFSDKNSGRRDG